LAVIEPGRRVVTALSIPLFAFFTVITVLLATGLRRCAR
jgi:hypothetical protein